MMRIAAALCMVVLSAGTACATDPVPEDFAYGMTLKTEGKNAIYGLPLPVDAYKGVTRGDLADLCVFNGYGEAVPYALRRPAAGPAAASETVPLPMFPISGGPEQGLEGLSLQVKKDASGSIVTVDTGGKAVPGRKVIAYLLDASRIDQPVSALVLDLSPSPEGTVCKVSVEASDDLERWSGVASGATVASLSYGGHSLERNTVELGKVKSKYFRIASAGPKDMIKVGGVLAVLAPEAVEQPRQWTSADASILDKTPDEYLFDLGGRMPVDRIRVMLAQENTLAEGTLLSRPDEKAHWVERGTALLYRLSENGAELVNPDLVVGPTTDRYWSLRVAKGGGLGRGVPMLEAGWVPHTLLFVARGEAPFKLAFGSGRTAGLTGGRGNYLLPEFTESQKEKVIILPAQAGPREVLGGDEALRTKGPLDWKQAALWSVLGLGVLVLAWMAVRLYKQMNVKTG